MRRPGHEGCGYARYSSNLQREASIADQFHMCRLRAEKEGWTVVEEYSDHSISGSSMIQRPGIQALAMDSTRGRFDMVLTEALDRISRDQEDIAGIYKRMRYADVKMFTLSQGRVDDLHFGLKGTMNALFLKDLADKTRRGLRGRIGMASPAEGSGYDVGTAPRCSVPACGASDMTAEHGLSRLTGPVQRATRSAQRAVATGVRPPRPAFAARFAGPACRPGGPARPARAADRRGRRCGRRSRRWWPRH